MSCYLALVLAESDERESAEIILCEGVVKIAKEHAEVVLLGKMKGEFPKYF